VEISLIGIAGEIGWIQDLLDMDHANLLAPNAA
jgi:hypothetical protein